MTGRTLRTCAVLLASSLAAWSYAPAVNAQEVTRPSPPGKPLAQALIGSAKVDYDAAKVLASDGDFAGALIKFQSAYDKSKDPRLLWNLAFCEKNMRHYSRVIAILNRYLAEGAGYLGERDRKEAKDLVLTLQPFTTNATFVVSEEGAQIFVDDVPVGVSPLTAPVVLDIGERRIRVVKDGFRPFERTLPVGGSAQVSVEVKLEKELHEGRLVVNAPPGTSIELDEKPLATGKFDGPIPSGGHQLRAIAPGMRPFQSEIVIQDKETRSIDIVLEKLGVPEGPKIRAAIGCDGPEPQGPDEGLVVYLDGPDVVPPANVKKKWSDSLNRNVVEYVEYAAPAGAHRVRARIPECTSLETGVTVDATRGADVTGALPTDTALLFRGPQGAPGAWRLGLDLWMLSPTFDSRGFRIKGMPEFYKGGLGAATGVAIEGGLIGRWGGVSVQAAWGSGSVQRASFDTNYALPATADTSAFAMAVRPAFRVPFNLVALNLGGSAGILELDVKEVRTGKVQGSFGLWASLDVQPLCDWGARVMTDLSAATDMNSSGPTQSLQVGLFWQPNARCRRERSTEFGLRAGGP
jgi:hypothetical protein